MIKTFIESGKTKIVFTGHSLGASVVLSALETIITYPHLDISCITFGSPKIGDQEFVDSYNSVVKNSVRIVDEEDIVPQVPPGFGYCHVNNQFLLKSSSTFSWVKSIKNLLFYIWTWKNPKQREAFAHSLENYFEKLSNLSNS